MQKSGLLLVLLLCSLSFVLSAEEDERAVIAWIDQLADGVDVLDSSQTSKYADSIKNIIQSLVQIPPLLTKLTPDEFEIIREHRSEEGLEVFEVIMKLFYIQSSRQRSEFTSPGGPHLRMFSFNFLLKLLDRFGGADKAADKKAYLTPKLSVTNPPAGFYDNADTFKLTVDEKDAESGYQTTLEWEGPFIEALETIEAQLYNFYFMWNIEEEAKRKYKRLEISAEEGLVVENALHNMLAFMDYIMSLDDSIVPIPDGLEETGAYISYFETSRANDILELISKQALNPKLATYAKYLVDLYFIGVAEGELVLPENRLKGKITHDDDAVFTFVE